MSDYCEWPQFYGETFPVARKEHRCVECKARIVPGEKHLKYVGKWGGEVSGGRQHMTCREACMFIRDKFQEGDCIAFGELREVWRYYAYHSRKHQDNRIKKFRSLMAQIKWRERGNK